MPPRPRPEVLDMPLYVAGEGTVPGANRVVKLSSNEGAFGPPPSAVAAAARAVEEMHRYPDSASDALRHALGAKYRLDPARIVCGNGSDELIQALCLAFGGAGTELVMSAHAFTMYEISGRYAGCRIVKVPERTLTTDIDAVLAAVTPATRLVFIANPNNPTGSLLPESEMARLRRGLPPEVLLVLDAAYAEYVEEPGYDPGVALVDEGDNTIMLRTFSKVYGLAGLRVGWGYATPAIIDVLNRVRGVFNVNLPAQAAAIAALNEPGWVERSRAHNSRARAALMARLEQAGLRCWPSHANFFLVDFGSAEASLAADAFLRSRGLLVRGVRGYDLPTCLRVTVGTDEECDLVAEALGAFAGRQAEATRKEPSRTVDA